MREIEASAGELAGRTRVNLDGQRCLRTRVRFSDCTRCVDVCPFEAITVEGSVALNADKCTGCGACLNVCPVGAVTGNERYADLFQCVAQRVFKNVVELACPNHPNPQLGPKNTDAVIRVGTCLAALSPSIYVLLLARGIKQLSLRLDRCPECALRQVKPQILETVAATSELLDACGQGGRLGALTMLDTQAWHPRPFFDSAHPTLSRRDLFRVFQTVSARAAASVSVPEELERRGAKRIPSERSRLLSALEQLPPSPKTVPMPETLLLTRLSADENCTACGVCVRVCPTGALEWDAGPDNRYQLSCYVGACTACAACFDVCAPDALKMAPAYVSDILNPEPIVLRQGTLRACSKCGIPFDGPSATDLCPICSSPGKPPVKIQKRNSQAGSRPPNS